MDAPLSHQDLLVVGSRNDPMVLLAIAQDGLRKLQEDTDLAEVIGRINLGKQLVQVAKTYKWALEHVNAFAEFWLVGIRKAGKILLTECPHGGDGNGGALCRSILLSFKIGERVAWHWRLAAKASADQFARWIEYCKGGHLEISQNRWLKAVERLDRAESKSGPHQITRNVLTLQDHIAAGRRFGCLLMTPAWQSPEPGCSRKTARKSMLLKFREINRFPIDKLAAESAQIHIWVTVEQVTWALAAMKRWKFGLAEISSIKSKIGLHTEFLRRDVSFLIAGVRGQCEFKTHTLPNWLDAEMKGSIPDETVIRKLLVRIGQPPFLHLFGQSAEVGWTVEPLHQIKLRNHDLKVKRARGGNGRVD